MKVITLVKKTNANREHDLVDAALKSLRLDGCSYSDDMNDSRCRVVDIKSPDTGLVVESICIGPLGGSIIAGYKTKFDQPSQHFVEFVNHLTKLREQLSREEETNLDLLTM